MEKLTQTRNKKKRKSAGQSKHYFAGANTGEGFYNLFDQINNPESPGTLYILKGGPGTGKSTLMKTVGKVFISLGYDIEYFYCSSDCASLDGVRLPLINVAIVDGTAPHVTEASMPGIREKIINLGEFIGSGLKTHEKEISALLKKKKLAFDVAYFYLNNAANLYNCNNAIYKNQNDKTNIKIAAKKIFASLSLEKSGGIGEIRKLFLSAVALDGRTDFEAQNNYSKIIEISHNTYVNGLILDQLATLITASGYDITCFMEILAPSDIAAIFIPKINVLIKQAAKIGATKANKYLSYNEEAIAQSLKNAAQSINEAKKYHKKVEAYYIPSMDFASISQATDVLIEEIKSSIKHL